MKKIISIVLALFFIHAAAMPSMMSFAAEENTCPMMGTEMDISGDEKENMNALHDCCNIDIAFSNVSVFQKEKQSVIPSVITDICIGEIQYRSSLDAFQYTKKYIPHIFLQYKNIIVMRI